MIVVVVVKIGMENDENDNGTDRVFAGFSRWCLISIELLLLLLL